VCVSAGYLRIRRCEVVRYDGLTTVPYPSYCLAVTRRRRIVVLVEREFIVSGGLGRCSTMTKLTVESLSRNPSDTFVACRTHGEPGYSISGFPGLDQNLLDPFCAKPVFLFIVLCID
jgi:hypothetical protein